MKRVVPAQFTTGGDRDNAAKAWLDGFDTALRDDAEAQLTTLQAAHDSLLRASEQPALSEGQDLREVQPDGAALIAAERLRQVSVEGWTPAHDDGHEGNELLQAAVWYLDNGAEFDFGLSLPPWPWEPAAWKPSDDRVRQLVKAGALIAAEIDRLKRRDAQ